MEPNDVSSDYCCPCRCRSRSLGRVSRVPFHPVREARRRRGTPRARCGEPRPSQRSSPCYFESPAQEASGSERTLRTQRAVPPAPAVNSTVWPPALLVKSASPIAASVATASDASAALPAGLRRVSDTGSRLRCGQSRCQWRPPQCLQGPGFSCHLSSAATRFGSSSSNQFWHLVWLPCTAVWA
eukprot:5934805-Pleurochrysis_carterae.AAC.4